MFISNKDDSWGYGGALALIEFRLVGPEKLRIYHKRKIKLRTMVARTANCLADAFLHHDASGAHSQIESCKASASSECIYFTPKSSLELNPIAESCHKTPTVVTRSQHAVTALTSVPRSHQVDGIKGSNFACT